MSQTRIILEQEKQTNASNGAMIGALVFAIILGLLYVSGIAHAAVRMGHDRIEANRLTRIVMLLVAIFFFPFYWVVYPIVYYSGGFKQ